MYVEVNGFDEEQTKLLEQAVDFFAKILFHGNLRNRLTIIVNRNPEMELSGECWAEDDANRQFIIDIRDGPDDDDPASTLAHEMIHVRQWAKGELTCTTVMASYKAAEAEDIKIGVSFIEVWKGEVWKPRRGEHPYFDAPWEVEAYGREIGMMARWKEYIEKE